MSPLVVGTHICHEGTYSTEVIIRPETYLMNGSHVGFDVTKLYERVTQDCLRGHFSNLEVYL